jgi:hypothetical protein
VRAATAPTTSTIKTDAKPISVATTTSMCYEPKQTHNTTTTSGAVSVLACFKTTNKRNKVCFSLDIYELFSPFLFFRNELLCLVQVQLILLIPPMIYNNV